MKKIFSFLIAIVFIVSFLVGCSNDPNSFNYEKYLKEQQKVQKNMPKVWFYKTDKMGLYSFERYNYLMKESGTPEKQYLIQIFSEMEYEEYQLKLQTALMTGNGPDILYTSDPFLLSDVNKTIKSGAFNAWDEYIKDWPMDEYYTNILNAYRSSNGKLYLLPLSINPHVIVTTKTNLEQYGLTSSDFSNYAVTMETTLRLCKQLEGRNDTFATPNTMGIVEGFPDIFNLDSPRAITDPIVQEVIQNTNTFLQYRNEFESKNSLPLDDLSFLLDGKYVYIPMSLDELVAQLSEQDTLTETQMKDIVLLPANTINGKMSGMITFYAMIPQTCKDVQAAVDLVYLTHREQRISPSGSAVLYKPEQELIYRLEYPNIDEILSQKIHTLLEESPMELYILNKTHLQYYTKIMLGSMQQNYDWSELERSINIYLSE